MKPEVIDNEAIDEKKELQKKKTHYVDNKALQKAYVEVWPLVIESLERGLEPPPMPNEVAKAILLISKNVSKKSNYSGYTSNWKEEMISDAVAVCCKYWYKYNPEKFKNPFAYITRMVDNAFKERLNKENLQLYVKSRLIIDNFGFMAEDFDDNNDDFNADSKDVDATQNEVYQDHQRFVGDYEDKLQKKKEKAKEKAAQNEDSSENKENRLY